MDKVYKWVADQSRSAAESWFRQQCANPFASLYLYYKQGSLVVAEELSRCPDLEYQLADGARIGPGGTIEQVASQIDRKARLLPVLPVELAD